MPQIEWVVFDLGEVLVKLDTPLMFDEMARVGGCSVEFLNGLLEGKIDDFVTGKTSTEAFYEMLLKDLPADPPFDEFCTALCSQLREPVEGMENLLEELSTKIKIACLSNTNDAHWKYCHSAYSLMNYLQVELTSHELHAQKPSPEIYRKAEKMLGTDSKSLLFLDDIIENVEGAITAGWNAFQFKGYQDCISKFREYGIN